MAKPAKKAAKSGDKKEKKDGEKALSPLGKARLAKKSGKGGKAKKAKKALPVFKAPDEFKPFFIRGAVKIGKDGLVQDVKVIRVKGSLKNENAKTVDLAAWDPVTLQRFAARYGAGTFVTNVDKRLPAGQMLKFVGRVSVKSSTGSLNVSLKEFKLFDPSTKKAKAIDSKSSDPFVKYYRIARKPARFLGAAFVNVKPFPSAAELKAMAKEEAADGEVKIKSKKKTKVKK